jgi:excisionase family DNA binding protein
VTAALAKSMPVNTNAASAPARSRDFLERQAFEAFKAFKAFAFAFQQLVTCGEPAIARASSPITDEPTNDVLTADEAAAFLGVDRNTVYDYAGRGAIPHQRLGKRILFGRRALVTWLDSSLCKARSTRKG